MITAAGQIERERYSGLNLAFWQVAVTHRKKNKMPNRIIRESICTSDSIDQLTWFEEVLFYRLIVNCDDYGRFDGRVAVIKSRLFPLKENLTNKHVSEAIESLASAGLVVLYEDRGRPLLYLPTWDDYQSVRAKKSKYPSPCEHLQANEIICNQMHANVPVIQSNPIQSESNPNTGIAPASFRPDPVDVEEYIAVKGYHFAAEEFMDYYDSVGWMQHGAPITNWMAKCKAFERIATKPKSERSRIVPMPECFKKPVEDERLSEEESKTMIAEIRKMQETVINTGGDES